MIEVKVVCDSIAEHAPRLTTMLWKYPKFVHQESLRHRTIYFEDSLRGDWDFSFSVSSARAIPFAKLLEEVYNPNLRAAPVFWGSEQKGMSPGDELPDHDDFRGLDISTRQVAKNFWAEAALRASEIAKKMAEIGVHKSVCNRIIEPFIHVNCLATATEPGWMNFFGLRLDKAADPTLRTLAEAAWRSWNRSESKTLRPSEWHLPFADDEETYEECCGPEESISGDDLLQTLIKISVARCARLSYLSFETNKRSTIEEDLKLYDRLVGSVPIHASPAEHQATPDEVVWSDTKMPVTENWNARAIWKNLEQAGNLGPGWRQYRKMLPFESIAPLPEAYR